MGIIAGATRRCRHPAHLLLHRLGVLSLPSAAKAVSMGLGPQPSLRVSDRQGLGGSGGGLALHSRPGGSRLRTQQVISVTLRKLDIKVETVNREPLHSTLSVEGYDTLASGTTTCLKAICSVSVRSCLAYPLLHTFRTSPTPLSLKLPLSAPSVDLLWCRPSLPHTLIHTEHVNMHTLPRLIFSQQRTGRWDLHRLPSPHSPCNSVSRVFDPTGSSLAQLPQCLDEEQPQREAERDILQAPRIITELVLEPISVATTLQSLCGGRTQGSSLPCPRPFLLTGGLWVWGWGGQGGESRCPSDAQLLLLCSPSKG